MDPLSLTMLFGSIGLQYFNNSATNKKTQELREKQNEAQRAAALHDFKRMHRLQKQSAKLAFEVEAELHRQRMEDIESNYDTVIEQTAHNMAINSWPLTVLPFVMRGESFGNIIGGGAKTIAIHCIVTPSNYQLYNERFYDDMDLRLEAEMNTTWNAQSSHPIVYYGGCWKKRDLKGVASCINLNEIDLLKSLLNSLPTIVITPYFDPKLHFRIKLWGMGEDIDYRLELKGNMFNYLDCYEIDRFPEGQAFNSFYAATIDPMVSYLQSLIGFIADKYFWSMYGVKPILPEIAQKQSMTKLIFKEQLFPIYKQELGNEFKHKEDYIRAIAFVDGLSCALPCDEKNRMLSNLYHSYIGMQGGQEELGTLDLNFLEQICQKLVGDNLSKQITECINTIRSEEDVRIWFCANKNELFQRIVNESEKFVQTPSHFVIEYRNDYYAIGCFCNNAIKAEYSEEGIAYYAVLLKNEHGNQCMAIDIETLLETETDCNTLFNKISIDEQYLREVYNAQYHWLQSLCEITESASYLPMEQLERAPIIDFTYQDLKDWIAENVNLSGEVYVIMGFVRSLGRYFYIVSGNACTKMLMCYCNTIDETMKDKFSNKTILTIKIN